MFLNVQDLLTFLKFENFTRILPYGNYENKLKLCRFQ